MDKRFNLIDEPWIKIAEKPLASLRSVFTDESYLELGGNPVEKLATLKLLLAITQSACQAYLNHELSWRDLDDKLMIGLCLYYLDKWYDKFWLYSDEPFLQMPSIVQKYQEIGSTKQTHLGAFLFGVSVGNTTLITEKNISPTEFTDAEKALIVLTINGFALGGKKTDNRIVLSRTYQGKFNEKGNPGTGRSGSCLKNGVLHNFLKGKNIIETIRLNLLTKEDIEEICIYKDLGIPPWEQMPTTENCEVAEKLKKSLMGRLLPMSKFYFLDHNSLYYTDGIKEIEGSYDPSMSFDAKDKLLQVKTEQRPWRELTSFLSFMDTEQSQLSYRCLQLKCISRAKKTASQFSIWSLGVSLDENAGEYYVVGNNDFVESTIFISKHLNNRDQENQEWFHNFKELHAGLNKFCEKLNKGIIGFYKETRECGKSKEKKTNECGKSKAKEAVHLFWQRCENKLDELLNISHKDKYREREEFNNNAKKLVKDIYDLYCPKDTAKQMIAWVKNRPFTIPKKRKKS